jgi:tetratricopeptide (TPR) repeat protein
MSRMVGEQSVPLGSEIYQTGVGQYRENLERLLARYEAAGIPVFIGTLAANERDQRPFATVHGTSADTTAYRAAMEEGLGLFARGDSAAAVPAFQRATEASGEAAEGHFRLGQALLASGDPQAARAAFLRAKDLDALRFRAPEAFNEAIREIADAHGATVVETQEAVRQASPDGVIGAEMMLEHLHPTLAGYDAIAGAFHEAVVASGLIAPEAQAAPSPRQVRLATDVDSLVGAIRVARLTENWPFRPDERQPLAVDTARTPPEVYRFADDLYADEVEWATATDAYATFEANRGNWADALRARQAMLMMYWFDGATHATLGSMRMQMAQSLGRPEIVEQARANYLAAVARDPDHGPSLSMLGAIHVQRSEEARASGAAQQATAEREEAIGYLERARRAQPEDMQVLYNLAGAYALQNRWRDALRTVDQLLARNPQHAAGLALKRSVLANMG